MRPLVVFALGSLWLAAALAVPDREDEAAPGEDVAAHELAARVRGASDPGIAAHELAARVRGASDPAGRVAGVDALTRAADRGDAAAQVALGQIYLQGLPGLPRDPPRARTWLLRAESMHHPEAALYLGILDQSGHTGSPDLGSAARWFGVAAERGSSEAMFRLANAYRAGAGVRRDDARAVALYEQAGQREHAGALQALAMAHLHGELGLTPDETEHHRYMRAAEHAITHLAADASHAHR